MAGVGWETYFPAERPGETLIIIVPFFRPEGVVDDDEAHFIQRSIRQHLEEQGMTHVRVEVATGKQVRAEHRAATIALVELYHPSMLIWGSNTRPEISINYLNLRHPDFETADVRLQEVGRAQLAPPDAYQDFISRHLIKAARYHTGALG